MNSTEIPRSYFDRKAKPHSKALIVDDEGQISLLLNVLLDGKGIECDQIKTISGVQHYIECNQPGLIILDNKLPDGFGINIIPFLKFNFPDTGLLMMSGFESAKKEALELGADIFLAKPFTLNEFHDAVHALLY